MVSENLIVNIEEEIATDGSKDANNLGDFCGWLARKLFFFLFAPIFGLLSYFTGARPYLTANYGQWYVGFIDGVITAISILIFFLWLNSKIHNPTQANKTYL